MPRQKPTNDEPTQVSESGERFCTRCGLSSRIPVPDNSACNGQHVGYDPVGTIRFNGAGLAFRADGIGISKRAPELDAPYGHKDRIETPTPEQRERNKQMLRDIIDRIGK